jgi:putative oxidoreductase
VRLRPLQGLLAGGLAGAPIGKASSVKRFVLLALRLALGALFVFAGAVKVADPSAFAIEIHNYQLFPALAPVLAATLPAVELAIGAALLVGPRLWVRAGALAAAALLVLFTVAVGSAVARGINISCGCFGAGSGPVTWMTVIRDVALLAASAAIVVMVPPGDARAPGAWGQSPHRGQA